MCRSRHLPGRRNTRCVWRQQALTSSSHKAAKAAPNVAVYVHRDPDQLLTKLAGERINRADALRVCAVDRDLLAAFVERLDRRMDFDLAISDRTIYLSLGDETLTGAVDERRIVA